MWGFATMLVILTALLVAACSSSGATGPGGDVKPPATMSACSTGPFLTRSPVALNVLGSIAPLGNLNPSGHVFPSDHTYWAMASGYHGVLPALVAPGNVTIVQAGRQSNQTGSQPVLYDYVLKFYACSDVMFYFYHISTLAPALLTQIGSFDKGCSAPYSTGGSNFQQCYVDVQIPMTAGAELGVLGTGAGSGISDFGAYDARIAPQGFVNPARVNGPSLQTVCPVDYFVPAVADSMRALLGGYSGNRRTVAPLCGTIMQDVANTAQGRWYFDETTMEDHHLALVHDNADPTVGVISMGTSVPSIPVTTYPFTPLPTGKVNADFSRVTADGSIYCFQNSSQQGQFHWQSSIHMLVQMPSAATLKIVGVSGATCGDPAAWSMTGASQFQR
jgi:hypothetical protein